MKNYFETLRKYRKLINSQQILWEKFSPDPQNKTKRKRFEVKQLCEHRNRKLEFYHETERQSKIELGK